MKSTLWKPEKNDLVVSEQTWTGDERLLEIVTIHKRGTFVTIPHGLNPREKSNRNLKQTWRPSRLGDASAVLTSGGHEKLRPINPGETADEINERNAERKRRRELERKRKEREERDRREQWLAEWGDELDRALNNPIPVYGDEFQLYVATVSNSFDEPVVVTFHVRDDTLTGGEPRTLITMGIADVVTFRHRSDGTSARRLGSIGSTYTNGVGTPDDRVAIKWALAGYFT